MPVAPVVAPNVPADAHALPEVKSFFQAAWSQFKIRYLGLSVIVLLQTLAYLVMGVVAAIILVPLGLFGGLAFHSIGGISILLLVLFAVIALVLGIAVFCLMGFFTSALTEAAASPGSSTFEESFRRAKGDWRPFTWLVLVTAFVALGSFGLFVIPWVIVVPFLVLAAFAFKLDGARGFGAIVRAADMVKGRWWSVFGRIILTQFVLALPVIILTTIQLSVSPFGVSGMHLAATHVGPSIGLSALRSLYVSFFWLPALLVFTGELYRELVASRPMPVVAAKGRRWPYVLVATLGCLLVIGTVGLFALAISSFGIPSFGNQQPLPYHSSPGSVSTTGIDQTFPSNGAY